MGQDFFSIDIRQSECIQLCEIGENTCGQNCDEEYTINLKNCPCRENCPLGCPCPNYQCPVMAAVATTTTASTTTTAISPKTTEANLNTWILVLNTFSSNVPLIIDGQGQSRDIEFELGSETEAHNSCSILWLGQMFVFGGDKYKRQISVVERCKLTKKGELPFDMVSGACAQRNNKEVFICFENRKDSSTNRKCRRSDGPLEVFTQLPNTDFDHAATRIAVTSGRALSVV